MTTSVALIGANGHGQIHRRRLKDLDENETVRLIALADVQPVVDAGAVAVYTDHRELLARNRPEVVVICTPPHTHLAIARDAFAAGCDVLLEKPPVRTLAEHRSLLTAARTAGRACQVGFQALGSAASARFGTVIANGGLGRVRLVSALASWQCDDAYYARTPWAGRRSLGGRPVVDGALVNPLAHALMQALDAAAAAGAGPPLRIEVERYRTREIEVDDTTFARITFESGLRVVAAVTLAGEEVLAGEVSAEGRGRAVLEYPADRLALPGESGPRAVPGRVDLLENLLAHRADPAGVKLLVPLERTAAFTAVLESLTALALPAPELLDEPVVESRGTVQVIRGITAVLGAVARTGRLPSEMEVPWAVTPYTAPVPLLT